ncbi:hybrid sensor histidine kinase/response regulator [Schlesneria paludicola]|uniref:hybrid sensor histidine kinase/response regulator n=1 Tax=Schlesneria paludicola TaxID=360056 RepID=UPI000299FF11|nr:hybrid sensor histidine kinase/response regulator [Schlesneria paludicola]
MTDRTDEFIIDAREHLGVVEDSLLSLEKQPAADKASAMIDRCFRSIHTIKGDAGFLGLSRIHELAHAIESLLSGTKFPVAHRMIELLFSARDRLAALVDDAYQSSQVDIQDIIDQLATASASKRTDAEFDVDLSDWSAKAEGGRLVRRMREYVAQRNVGDARLQLGPSRLSQCLPTGPVRWSGVLIKPREEHAPPVFEPFVRETRQRRSVRLNADLSAWSRPHQGVVDAFLKVATAVNVVSGRLTLPVVDLFAVLPSGNVTWTAECEAERSSDQLHKELNCRVTDLDCQGAATSSRGDTTTSVAASSSGKSAIPANARTPFNAPAVGALTMPSLTEKSSTLRIQVELLDRMMTLVGELTLVRNQSLLSFSDEDATHRSIIQRLNSVTSELQDVTLRARMQPVGNLFAKFPRMVRDLARQLGKQVDLELLGRDVELDKSIIEQLSDPLMHLIRNSVDHGIEMPAEREAQGKPPAGRIVLSATHEDGQIQIQVRDDGKGIDSAAVRAKALAVQLRTAAELDRMVPRELFSLILLPGFSTATHVTEVSGRGVGMDVVKTNIEQLEGTISIDSDVGRGTTMTLKLPLTLAIIRCLIVTVGPNRFAVPQRDLEEVICLHPKASGHIELAFDTEVYRLRDRLLPIVRFSDVVGHHQRFTAEKKAELLAARTIAVGERPIEYILVLRQGSRRFGLVVDEVRGTQEIVVKPMHPSMKRVNLFAGATIMGDGHVALIADVDGIVDHANLSFDSAVETLDERHTARDAAQVHRVLLFEYGPREQFALPLIQIRRVELIHRDRIERAGDHEFVTVDGVSTRILRLDRLIHTSTLESDPALMTLILPKFVSLPMGILVSRIVDTESLALDIQQHPDLPDGILGSAIVRDRLTLFLELHHLSEKLFGTAGTVSSPGRNSERTSRRVLLIDDTAFFREVVKRYLVAEGFDVTTAIHGADGLKILSTGRPFDLIVSDIEMPVMDGWEFAREVRRRGIKTPMLALTSLSGEQNEAKAKECGYDGYEVKLDHDRLVRKVSLMSVSQANSN